MMKILRLVLILMTAASASAFAQESYAYFSWDYTLPLTSTNFIGGGTARGAKAGFRKFIGQERRFSAGLDVSWHYLREYKPTETFYSSNGAITTDYFNDIYSLNAVLSGQYYFRMDNQKHFFPYAGLGLGANRNRYSQSYNIYKDTEEKFGFLARPELGVLIRIGDRRRWGVMAAAHYDFSTNSSARYAYSNYSTAGFQLGVMLWQW